MQAALLSHTVECRAGPVAEQVLLLENIGTSLQVGPTQLASLHKLLVQATTMLHMKSVPDLYVRQNPVPNAYTLAIAGRRPFVVVHTALLELLEPAEVQVQLQATCLPMHVQLEDALISVPAVGTAHECQIVWIAFQHHQSESG